MKLMGSDDKIQIGTLRVRGQEGNRAGLRLTLSHLFSSADLRPDAIPPSAVLFIRRMEDPLPGHIAPHPHAMRVDSAWERAVRNRLSDLYQRACRPDREAVPPDAPAVLFADAGEMLACLALDMARGQAASRWWWQMILRKLPSSSAAGLPSLLASHAVTVPAVLHHLAARSVATEVMHALSPTQTITVLAAVGRAYEVNGLGASLTGQSAENRSPTLSEPQISDNFRRERNESLHEATPWPAHLTPAALGREQACLLGVALTLYIRPAAVRSEPFLRKLHTWWVQTDPALSAAGHNAPGSEQPDQYVPSIRRMAQAQPPPADSKISRATSVWAESSPGWEEQAGFFQAARSEEEGRKTIEIGSEHVADGTPDPRADEPRAVSSGHDKRQAPESVRGGNSPFNLHQRSATTPQGGEVHRPQPVVQRQGRLDIPGDQLAANAARGQTAEQDETRHASDQREPKKAIIAEQDAIGEPAGQINLWPPHGIQTGLGGVLYLINLICRLDLPDCFEADWRLASDVGRWGVLDAVARGLLTGSPELLADDPLWAALAQLDGRDLGQPPGATLAESPGFRLPSGWLPPDPGPEPYCWSHQEGRLRLWSAHGYLLLDCPNQAPVSEQQIRSYLPALGEGLALQEADFDQAPVEYLSGTLVAGFNPHLMRWLAWVLPYLRWRLRRMLNPGTPNEVRLVEDLLVHSGHLYMTTTHIDLVMSLDDISVPVRLAGLDRNPGWLADLGRVVLFHFE